MKNLKWRPKYIVVGGKKKKAKRIYWKKAKVYFWYRQRLESNYTSFQEKKKTKTKARIKWTEKFKNLKLKINLPTILLLSAIILKIKRK